MCVYLPCVLPDIMITLYGCIPTRYYNGHSLLPDIMVGVYLPDIMVGVYLPDIMVTLYVCITYTRDNSPFYGCIPTRYNGHLL